MTNQLFIRRGTDYRLFEADPLNRGVEPRPDLISSMNEFGFWPEEAITVEALGRSHFRIKDGHHRFATAKHLGIPFYYIIRTGVRPTLRLEAKRWTLQEYLESYADKQQKVSYQTLKAYMNRTGIPIAMAVGLHSGFTGSASREQMQTFCEGDFRVTNETLPRQVEELFMAVRAALPIDMASWPKAMTAQVLASLILTPEFDFERMKNKLTYKYATTALADLTGSSKIIAPIIASIYDRQEPEPSEILFYSRKAGKQRALDGRSK